jgi:hypothetical protein
MEWYSPTLLLPPLNRRCFVEQLRNKATPPHYARKLGMANGIPGHGHNIMVITFPTITHHSSPIILMLTLLLYQTKSKLKSNESMI